MAAKVYLPVVLKTADSFTSTGQKFWHHPEALKGLQNGHPRPVVTHLMPTDICQHTCAFCSVQTREGNILDLSEMTGYLDQLVPLGLKAVIISGGGNPILYKKGEADFNDLVNEVFDRGLEIGVITNGMPLKDYRGRKSYKTVTPETLDKLTWLRISMSGLDHKENEVFVPDVDPNHTTLGFSYVYHDIYEVPEEPNHGKVSTEEDLLRFSVQPLNVRTAESRFDTLTGQIREIVEKHHPSYVRLLPNCLEPEKITNRCNDLQRMANLIDPKTVFVQYKPPEGPKACYLGYLHPVLNSDGYVYPCDSCVLNKAAGHKFAEPWRICHWSKIGQIYNEPSRSLIKDPRKQCPGCVFTKSNELLIAVKEGMEIPEPEPVTHPNFI